MSPQINKAEVRIGNMSSRGTFPEILEAQISIVAEGGPKISKEKTATTVLKTLQITFWLH